MSATSTVDSELREDYERSSLSAFLGALFQPGHGLIELRAKSSDAITNRRFIESTNLEAVEDFCRKNGEDNCYFGVASRRDNSSGAKSNLSTVRALFADLDYKAFFSPEAARASLDN